MLFRSHPSQDIVESLEELGILYDTSVFKWGKIQTDVFSLDYTEAHSDIFPWRVDPSDINRKANRAGLYEIPILTRRTLFTSMLTGKRLSIQRKLEKTEVCGEAVAQAPMDKFRRRIKSFRPLYPRKFDFCRMTFKELRNYADYAIERCSHLQGVVPVVAIGHSGEFMNDGDLDRFLEYMNSQYDGRFCYTTFAELERSAGAISGD